MITSSAMERFVLSKDEVSSLKNFDIILPRINEMKFLDYNSLNVTGLPMLQRTYILFLFTVRIRRRHGGELSQLVYQVFQEANRRRILPLHHRGRHQQQDEALRGDVELRIAERV